MKKLVKSEQCPKCGSYPGFKKLHGPSTGYTHEFITLRCLCGHEWDRLPLDAKESE